MPAHKKGLTNKLESFYFYPYLDKISIRSPLKYERWFRTCGCDLGTGALVRSVCTDLFGWNFAEQAKLKSLLFVAPPGFYHI